MLLLDRERERRAVESFLDEPSGSARILLMEGPEGVGKSELLRFTARTAGWRSLRFHDDRPLFSCARDDAESEFGFLTPLVGALAVRNPGLFAQSTSEGARTLPLPPLSQLVVHAMSSLRFGRGIREAMSPDLDEMAQSRSEILLFARSAHAIQALTSFIEKALQDEYPKGGAVVICDDAEWMDATSLRVLLTVARRQANVGRGMSIVLSATDPEDRESDEALFALHDRLRDYPDIASERLLISPLDRATTIRILEETDRGLSDEERAFVYETTVGNFRELTRLLRCEKDRLRLLYQNWRMAGSSSHPFSKDDAVVQHIRQTMSSDSVLRGCYLVLAVLGNECTLADLRLLLPLVTDGDAVAASDLPRLRRRLEQSLTLGDMQLVGEYLVGDRRSVDAARIVAMGEGGYGAVAGRIATRLWQDTSSTGDVEARRQAKALKIWCATDVLEAWKQYRLRYGHPIVGPSPPLEVSTAAARAFARSFREAVPETEVEAGVALLSHLTAASHFGSGWTVGNSLLRCASLPEADRFRALHDQLVCAREAGYLEEGIDRIGGPELIRRTLESARTPTERVEARILCASVLEHLGEYDRIRVVLTEADTALRDIRSLPERARCWVALVRHLGLAHFHGDLIDQYREALDRLHEAQLDPLAAAAERAGLHNHIGLGLYHTGRLPEAKVEFGHALRHLEVLGRRLETPLNNLGACHLLLGDIPQALETFHAARSIALKPAYHTLSLDINYAICLSKLNEVSAAIDILRPLADGVRSVPDPAVRSHAQVNLAYCLMQDGQYLAAAQYYMSSNTHRFRFLTDDRARVRAMLARYCAARAGALPGEDLGDFSFVDLGEAQAVPVRRPYQLDLNSLYVI